MNKLTLLLATTAMAAASSSFVTTAEAGGRGGHHRLHFHLLQLHHLQQQRSYRNDDDDDDYRYVKRRKNVAKVVTKPAAKPVEKTVEVARYIDGKGRQFDLVSKVWFDGANRCWMGDKPFAFKSGSWFYGNARWIESSAGWGVVSGDAPEQVSCDGIKAFAGKIEQAAAKPITKKVAEAKPEKIEQAEVKSQTVAKPAKVVTAAPETTAKATECKKYFPSVGEMVVVPCSE